MDNNTKMQRNLKAGNLIAFNKNVDATWFKVVRVDGFNIVYIPTRELSPGRTHFEEHIIDRSYVEQVRESA